ncbi:acyltransferase family protein [Pseudoalteromonas sp. SR41-1]|uniref:acyltransferase family protein n=1 Tax=Pseudoalteromonas sp. SR41-1 TaxID=2760952 RepID=UPI0038F7397E
MLRDRLNRVMIPLIFTGGTINSVFNYYSFNEHYSGVYNYILKGDWMGHLWFIGNLAIYYLCFYFLLTLCCKSKNVNNSKIYYFLS